MLDGAFAPWHIVVLAVLFVVLFGSKRLPEGARAVGQSLRILKAETRALPESTPGQPPLGVSARTPRFDAYTGLPLGDSGTDGEGR